MAAEKYIPSIRDIAYHEAAHTVAGHLFYTVDHVVIAPGELLGRATHGDTKVNTPETNYLGEAEDRASFIEYLKLIICLRGGRYCQYVVSGTDDAAGAVCDEEFLTLHLYNRDGRFYAPFGAISSLITRDFFNNESVVQMVAAVAEKLIIQGRLSKEEIHELLKDLHFDWGSLLDTICDRYHATFIRLWQRTDLYPLTTLPGAGQKG